MAKLHLFKRIEYTENNIKFRKYYLWKFLYLVKENAYEYRKTKFLNIVVSNKKRNNLVNKNYLNLHDLFSFKNNVDKSNKVNIIIPVYNGYNYLTNFFDSIYKNTELNYSLIVVNDNSTDERVLPLLEKYQFLFNSKMQLINNEKNLGFVKSVNKALKVATEHVIILNTDVVVPQGWDRRLLYQILNDKKIASVTPFSNAATIFSLPENCVDNVFEDDLQTVDNAISRLNVRPDYINFPTGVGFCMAMNKDAISEVGLLDEIFGKGYGEENDWCQRAQKKGYINAIAPNLFLWHKHGGSFNSKEKQELISNNLKIIKKRYPKYLLDIKNLLDDNKYLSLRFWAELLYLWSVSKSSQVWFDHTWGGGTEVYTFNKINELKNDTFILRVQNNKSNLFCISYYYKNYKNQICIEGFEDLELIIKQITPDMIVVNNLASFKDILATLTFIEKVKNNYKIKISFRSHDFQCICPSITMVNSENEYCNCDNFKNCQICYNKIKAPSIKVDNIFVWQTEWTHFINDVADEIVVFSQASEKIFKKFFNINNKIQITPHSVRPLRKVNIPAHKDIIIGVLGNINVSKGSLILKDIDKLLPNYPNVKIKIIGSCNIKKFKNIKILGKYKLESLPDIIEQEQIDMIFIPSIWPETFSYTTSEAVSMGLPVACFNLGAPAERNYNGCIITEINAQKALNEISLFVKNAKNQKGIKNIQKSYTGLKKNIKKRGNVNIVFMVSLVSMFPARPFMDYLIENGNKYNVKILIIPDLRFGSEYAIKFQKEAYEELVKAYGENRIVTANIDEQSDDIDIKNIADLIVPALPYDVSHPKYNLDNLINSGLLPVMINYGYFRSKYDRTLISSQQYSKYWKVFVENKQNLSEFKRYQIIKGANCVLTGYCKMDNYRYFENKFKNSQRKTVLISPHHSVEGGYNDVLALSNFYKYSDLFLELPDRYPDINFIFRPHPVLFSCLLNNNFWDKEKIDKYISAMKNKKNVRYSEGGNYLQDFAESDAIIQDCGSFLVDYFYTLKPQCYMLKSKEQIEETFSDFGKKCMDNVYQAFNETDIINFIDNVVISGKDEKKSQREKFAKKDVMINYPNVSEKIYMHLNNELGINK